MALPSEGMEPKDIVIVLSCSGDSKNIIDLLKAAKAFGGRTIGLLGSGGGEALSLCDGAVVSDSEDAGAVEDVHSVVLHMLKEMLDKTSKERIENGDN